MEEAVRGRFLLDYPRKGGVSLRKTLEDVERQSGVHDEQLDITEIPTGFEAWYFRFMELRRGDGVSFGDIRAYEEVMNVKLAPVEVAAIMAMDRGASAAIAIVMKENANAG